MSTTENPLIGLDVPVCGVLGCGAEAEYVIEHPRHGERVVCEQCTRGYPVVDHV